MGLFNTLTNQAILTTLALSRQQETIITNNMANYDTPGFKASGLSFQTQLAAALQQGPQAVAAVTGTVATQTGALRTDGNSVSLTGQMVDLAKAQLTYQTAVQALNTKVTEIKIVTEGRPQ
ncbi:MAG: flagellar basal body rod protein FlgB [Sulfobacillus sp.]